MATGPDTPTPTSWSRRSETLLVAGLAVYVILLLIGTIGNLFEIEAITSFWLYR